MAIYSLNPFASGISGKGPHTTAAGTSGREETPSINCTNLSKYEADMADFRSNTSDWRGAPIQREQWSVMA